MTTTAQAIPSFEVSAPDDNMDDLSDTAFDFGDGDGDIDLDLDTAHSVHDDDMSLNDAATEGSIDISEHIDQDDFMADHGDLIEEEVYNEDNAAISQTVDESAASIEADMLAPPDEDLIDYSDDEALQPIKMQSPSVPEDEDVQISFDLDTTPVQADHVEDVQTQEDEQPLEPITTASEDAQIQEHGAENIETVETSSEHDPQNPELQNVDVEEIVHADNEGDAALPTEEHSQHDDEAAAEPREEQQEEANEDHENVHQEDHQIELRPVTVNYAGNELWLFKHHDLDDSGDFLLEDLSTAKSSISHLFQACRLSLGDDVSGEHEIGFRFDHLHNMELYEDNTACVAVSLERMVDLYHTLQAQDGNEDPECFYITLQFRPRFATLLADIAQYAEQGSGYSALDAAVSAGETHFSNIYSSASTEHDRVEWDEEENEEEDASSPVTVHSLAQEDQEADQQGGQESGDAEGQELGDEHGESFNQGDHQQHGDAALLQKPGQAQDAQHEESYDVQEAFNLDPTDNAAASHIAGQTEPERQPQLDTAAEQHAPASHDERTPDQIAHEKQEAEDFVDYSDDEDEQGNKSAQHEASPSSSTVQGDDITGIRESSFAPEHEKHDDADADEAELEEHDDDTTLLTQTQYGDDTNHYAFQDYTEKYEQGDPFRNHQADGAAEDPFEGNGSYSGDTNHDFADYNYQEMDGEVNFGFDEQSLHEANHGEYGDETYEAVEDVTHADALLDLDNAPEWAVDADPAPYLPGEDAVVLHDDTEVYEDDEGGAVEQPGATASSAADLALTSSNDHKPSSPQGQKRSIDEVGNGIDDAPDSTDAKRAR
ncbi:hypothetical protein E8E12_009395 [Didymella heteroderae]|uniref:Uncharacterized protein n=1 Tax=Didymella heteroderae TaxID=1769908 RepID=A0A9P4WTJ3_9PLEO|nr:hypothetical protein E8E12_009395 [Didymella heteroderae]